MAQLDVWQLADGGLVLDCQHGRFDDIGTRFVVPLIPAPHAPPHNQRLNPIFSIDGEALTMVTQFATSIRTVELRRRVATLRERRDDVIAAIDTLIGAR
jgi:toxin CcdB